MNTPSTKTAFYHYIAQEAKKDFNGWTERGLEFLLSQERLSRKLRKKAQRILLLVKK